MINHDYSWQLMIGNEHSWKLMIVQYHSSEFHVQKGATTVWSTWHDIRIARA